MSLSPKEPQQLLRQRKQHPSSRLSSLQRTTRLAPASSQASHGRVATSPDYRTSSWISLPSDSNFFARSYPILAAWRLLPILEIRALCRNCARFIPRSARSASRSSHSKSNEQRISRPPSRRSKVTPEHFMSVPTLL